MNHTVHKKSTLNIARVSYAMQFHYFIYSFMKHIIMFMKVSKRKQRKRKSSILSQDQLIS